MLTTINRLHSTIAGGYSRFNIHERVLNTVLFIAQFVVAIIFYTTLQEEGFGIQSVLSAIFFSLFFGFYIASRVYKKGKMIIPIYLGTGALVLTTLYFFSGGINGPIPIYFLLGLVLSITILKKKFYWTVFLGAPFLIVGCYLLEVTHPEMVIGHVADNDSNLHILISILVSAFIVLFTLVTFKNNFDGQYKISRKQYLQLERARVRLQKAKEEAEKSNKVKSEFLSTMSHEIRTPLNAVIGMTYLLIKDNPRDDQRENLSTLRYSAENLMTLINDVLDYSKIEAGKVVIEKSPFGFFHILKFLKASHGIEASKKGLSFTIETDENIPDEIIGDSNRLIQILNNLISNAIKFTEEGGVTLIIKSLGVSGNKIKTQFEVIDTGIGIPREAQEIVFESFSQADSSITRKHGGTGLGLSITKNLVSLLGGEIKLESELRVGSKFTFIIDFELDIEKPENQYAAVSDDFSLEEVSILVVDDNPINQQVAQKVLRQKKGEVDFANDGQEALEMWAQKNYDLILMDVRMPVLDGIAATRQIRQLPNGEKPLIIALTASALYEERQDIIDCGMEDFVTKPFDPEFLYSKIQYGLQKKKLYNENNILER